METVQQCLCSKTCHISTRFIEQISFQKSGKDQFEYETVDVFLDSGSATFSIGGDAWVLESLTKRKFTLVVYDSDTVK